MLSPYASFELLTVVVAGLCGVHAYRTRDLPFFGTAVVYGVVLEKLVVLGFEDYTYPAARFVDVAGIPLAIGLGWSVVLYAGYETARRWEIDPPARAAFVALFVLHVDLALDAVAIRVQPVGFWTWTPAGEYFGVPLGNFFGWFAVGFLFVAVYDVALGRAATAAWSDGVDEVRARAVAAAVTLVAASALLYVAMFAWDVVTLESTLRKAIVLGSCMVAAGIAVARSNASLRQPATLPSLAVFLTHGYFLAALLWLGVHRTEPFLLAMSLAMLGVAAALHVAPVVLARGRSPEATPETP
ncbi:carotenoid biosynthesis protein [Halorubellus sp. JP-L1]|uniref:carotenoid biosynthesis protein n=1 Tax=Halorubellus sp. JP-L1 TaxID=2715753 RepID=UPI00140E59FD|nr:carotenoid biosynthesis protein [Halorubellus sp. JP-L1]NHN42433.1 carotenoid biosynthesis protein [Halorubellus sp. JP-L1]